MLSIPYKGEINRGATRRTCIDALEVQDHKATGQQGDKATYASERARVVCGP